VSVFDANGPDAIDPEVLAALGGAGGLQGLPPEVMAAFANGAGVLPGGTLPVDQPVPVPATRMPEPGGYFARLSQSGANPLPIARFASRPGHSGTNALAGLYDLIAGFANAGANQALGQRAQADQFNKQQQTLQAAREARGWAAAQKNQSDRISMLGKLSLASAAAKAKAAAASGYLVKPEDAAKFPALGASVGQRIPFDDAARFKLVPPKESAQGVGGAADDGSLMGEAIINGLMSPNQLGTRMTQYNKPVFNYLAGKKYDMQKAQLDAFGVQRWMASLNGPQQTRLRQAIDATTGMLGQIRSYNQQLRGLVPRGSVAMINRASIGAAMNGAYGPQAADVAKKMSDQMALVGTELAQVMSGGYSPLDKALGDAGKVLDKTRSPQQIDATLDNLERDLGYRRNSILTAGPLTVSNPLGTPEGQFTIGGRTFTQPAAPAAGRGNLVRMKAPDGRTLQVPPEKVDEMKAHGAVESP
jgi:hypothetical protein